MPKTLPVLEDTAPLRCGPLDAAPGALPYETAVALAVRLKALADPVRVQLVSYLLARPALEACTCDLAPAVGLSEPTVSHHLKQLLQAGLVEKERRGANVFYRLVPDSVSAVGRTLTLSCC
ncbi:ArsR/SmtB family transcription factor [Vallicoccus soli]|uniref:Transcriptional regulator n=1 Tax=Vallicoccus soli TaxID=2339232 RepID=A0A3A3Z210_9ACTN|nr:metalloregulator ArsR/SmtB family transcription factor [Vallicoccus soli]RJK97484.1 transcriptional regulator [Vallicoccus soli]